MCKFHAYDEGLIHGAIGKDSRADPTAVGTTIYSAGTFLTNVHSALVFNRIFGLGYTLEDLCIYLKSLQICRTAVVLT